MSISFLVLKSLKRESSPYLPRNKRNKLNHSKICRKLALYGRNSVTKGPEGASVPSLGLSNKAVFTGSNNLSEEDSDGYFVPVDLTEPPTEETLMQNTLWPEHQKLYGHGYEVYALAASGDGMLLASTCKATDAEHAAVLLWETKCWTQIQRLVSHTLTVTQVEFSADSRRLVSVSRDRLWTLFQRRQDSNLFDMVAKTDKTNGVHTRIIWCCAWAHDGVYFGTGSRDGKSDISPLTDKLQIGFCGKQKGSCYRFIVFEATVHCNSLRGLLDGYRQSPYKTSFRQFYWDLLVTKVCVWTKTDITPAPPKSSLGAYALHGKALELSSSSVTALAFAPLLVQAARVVAVGLESGVVRLYAFDGVWALIHVMDTSAAHHLTVKRLAFKPQKQDIKNKQAMLASCGSDHLVRLHCISVL